MYFTLKDETSLIKCVMFKSYVGHLSFMPKDGMKVNILGSVNVFERDGVYQIYAKAMKEDGKGDLYEEYEKLKKKLEEEGLFDEKYKKKIPFMPKVIGVLTASTGSVIRDIINVSTRRNKNVYIRLMPVPVQGEGAGEEIARAIKFMNDKNLADVLIIGRGGGSLEDLWAFNEEVVARAIFDSKIPIISAVGHETDFTIADFVADLRAPTPSAAAELAVQNIEDIKYTIESLKNNLRNSLRNKLNLMRKEYEKQILRKAFTDPLRRINDENNRLTNNTEQILNLFKIRLEKEKTRFKELVAKIDTMSPLKTLTRGYSIIEKEGKVIKSKKDLVKDEEIKLTLSDGSINAKVM